MWYIYTMEYYSAIKRKEIIPLADMWMGLSYRVKYVRKKKISYINAYMWNLKN